MPEVGEILIIDEKLVKIIDKQDDAYILEGETGSLSNITESEIQSKIENE